MTMLYPPGGYGKTSGPSGRRPRTRRDGFDDTYTRLMHRTQIKGTEAPILP